MKTSDLQVEVSSSCRNVPAGRAAVRRIVQQTLAAHGRVCAEIDVAIIGDKRMRAMNRYYAGKDRVTDVLSFDLSDPADKPTLHGQIVVNWHQARRQARKLGHSARAELMLYVVHGLLHLLGYRDDSRREFVRMQRAAGDILAAGGYRLKG